MNFDQAKSQINLAAFIVERYEFTVDAKESSTDDPNKIDRKPCYWILRRGSDSIKSSIDKVGVSLTAEGRWLYADNRPEDTHGKGSIIDWILRHHEDITTPRQALAWLKDNYVIPSKSSVSPDQKDQKELQNRLDDILYHIENNTTFIDAHPFLKKRGLIEKTLLSRRFTKSVKIDKKKNAIFPTKDINGICGYSVKNTGFTTFSARGRRGLWVSNCFTGDKKLVICESALDCMSHYQYFESVSQNFVDDTRYISIEGNVSPEQIALIIRAAAKVQEVILSCDDDKEGARFEDKILEHVSAYIAKPPHGFKDWNEMFQGDLETSA